MYPGRSFRLFVRGKGHNQILHWPAFVLLIEPPRHSIELAVTLPLGLGPGAAAEGDCWQQHYSADSLKPVVDELSLSAVLVLELRWFR